MESARLCGFSFQPVLETFTATDAFPKMNYAGGARDRIGRFSSTALLLDTTPSNMVRLTGWTLKRHGFCGHAHSPFGRRMGRTIKRVSEVGYGPEGHGHPR